MSAAHTIKESPGSLDWPVVISASAFEMPWIYGITGWGSVLPPVDTARVFIGQMGSGMIGRWYAYGWLSVRSHPLSFSGNRGSICLAEFFHPFRIWMWLTNCRLQRINEPEWPIREFCNPEFLSCIAKRRR